MVDPAVFRRQLVQAAHRFGFPENYEEVQLDRFVAIVKDAPRFVDIGANRGIYSYLANLNMIDSEIILIEAHPIIASNLDRDIETWPREGGNSLKVVHCAASDAPEIVSFSTGDLDTIGTASRITHRKGNMHVQSIRADSIDNLIPPLENTVFKVDVEGFEYRVLAGAMNNLSAHGCRLIVELHSWGDPERGKYPLHVIGMMAANGFSIRRIAESYSYEFKKGTCAAVIASYLQYLPFMASKYLVHATSFGIILRRMGLAKRPI